MTVANARVAGNPHACRNPSQHANTNTRPEQ